VLLAKRCGKRLDRSDVANIDNVQAWSEALVMQHVDCGGTALGVTSAEIDDSVFAKTAAQPPHECQPESLIATRNNRDRHRAERTDASLSITGQRRLRLHPSIEQPTANYVAVLASHGPRVCR
jgi:hypothetical protein